MERYDASSGSSSLTSRGIGWDVETRPPLPTEMSDMGLPTAETETIALVELMGDTEEESANTLAVY